MSLINKPKHHAIKHNSMLFLYGVLISAFSFSTLLLLAYSNERYIYNDSISFYRIMQSLSYCVLVAFVEELLFRYLFLRKWISDKTKKYSKSIIYLCLISSVVFGFLHFNLDEFPMLQINCTLSGISLFYATYMFRSISIGVGMHFSWNFIQGVIFPFEGSGSNLGHVFLLENKISVWPEANSLGFVCFLMEMLMLTLLYRIFLVSPKNK